MTPRDLLRLAAPLLVGQGWRFSEDLATLLGYQPKSRANIGKAARGEMPVSRPMLERLLRALVERRAKIDRAIRSLTEHLDDKSLQYTDLQDSANLAGSLDVRRDAPHNGVMVSIERIKDGKWMQVDASRIRYGVGTEALTLAAGLLRKKQREGDATYYLPPSASFGQQIVILD